MRQDFFDLFRTKQQAIDRLKEDWHMNPYAAFSKTEV